jgi:hypothetical protein
MISLYIFALIVGGGLLLLSLMGDLVGAETDAVDIAVDVPGNADAGKVLTLRHATYFLFGFGAVGTLLVLRWPDAPAALPLAAALAVGLAGSALAGWAFRWLRRTDSGETAGDDQFVGLAGRVVLPLGPGRTGRVLVRQADREYELRALPLDAAAADTASWDDVLVVRMEEGTAFVSPLNLLPE